MIDVSAEGALQSVAGQYLLEMIKLGPSSIRQAYASKIELLKVSFLKVGGINLHQSHLNASKSGTRTSTAHILGIIMTSNLEVPEFKTRLLTLIEHLFALLTSKDKSVTLESKDGAYLALGFFVGRLIYRYQDKVFNFVPEATLCELMLLIEEGLGANSNGTTKSCCLSLAEATRYSTNDMAFKSEKVGGEGMVAERAWKIEETLDKLINLSKKSTDAKV